MEGPRLERLFESAWPKLESRVEKAKGKIQEQKQAASEKSERDLLLESVELMRGLHTRMSKMGSVAMPNLEREMRRKKASASTVVAQGIGMDPGSLISALTNGEMNYSDVADHLVDSGMERGSDERLVLFCKL